MLNYNLSSNIKKVEKNDLDKQYILFGNRIPKDFFITSGIGESDISIHAGSFHLALKDAGIEKCNIINYSSILPSVAREVKKPKFLIHGSVIEAIMAIAHSTMGERATAGIIVGWLYEKSTRKKYGGIVCEYNGSLNEKEAKEILNKSINEIYENGFSDKFYLIKDKVVTRSIIPKKRFGSSIVALCFLNYLYPVVNQQIDKKFSDSI